MDEGPKEKVGDYMKSPVICIESTATLQEAAQMMQSTDTSALIITEGGEHVGIVTEKDFTRKVVGGGLELSTPVSKIINKPLYTIDRHEHILQGIEMMKDKNTWHLTITDRGRVVGLITIRDTFSYYMNLFGLES